MLLPAFGFSASISDIGFSCRWRSWGEACEPVRFLPPSRRAEAQIILFCGTLSCAHFQQELSVPISGGPSVLVQCDLQLVQCHIELLGFVGVNHATAQLADVLVGQQREALYEMRDPRVAEIWPS